MDGEAALLWQEHGLHRLYNFLCDRQLIEGQSLSGGDDSEVQSDYFSQTMTAADSNLPQIGVCTSVISALSRRRKLCKISCTRKTGT